MKYLKGQIITSIAFSRLNAPHAPIGADQMRLYTKKAAYIFQHLQDCCEEVLIEQVDGDFDDLLDSPILIADVATTAGESRHATDREDSKQVEWTFYRFATIKGYVTVRWLGTSNGAYSTGVDVVALTASESESI